MIDRKNYDTESAEKVKTNNKQKQNDLFYSKNPFQKQRKKIYELHRYHIWKSEFRVNNPL